MNKNNWKLRVW